MGNDVTIIDLPDSRSLTRQVISVPVSQKNSNAIRQNGSNKLEFQLLQHWIEKIGLKGKKKENIPRYAAVSAVTRYAVTRFTNNQ